MEGHPSDHIEYYVAYSKIGVLFRVTNNDLSDLTYDKVYLPANLSLLMIRNDVDQDSDGIQVYWPYFNVPIRLVRQYNDKYTVAVIEHSDSNKIMFYMQEDFLEDPALFSSLEGYYIDRLFDDDIDLNGFLEVLKTSVHMLL